MRQCYYPIVIFTYLSCCGFNPHSAVASSPDEIPALLKIAQADSSDTNLPPALGMGSQGEDVKLLQTQLKKLGHYTGIPDGQFGSTTRDAVIEFQQKKNLAADGIVGNQTKELIKTETLKQTSLLSKPTPEPVSEESSNQKKSSQGSLIKFGLIAMGILAGAGTFFYIFQWLKYSKRLKNTKTYVDDDTLIVQTSQHQVLDTNQDQKYLTGNNFEDVPSTAQSSQGLIPTEKTSRIAKVNVVEKLIADLESTDSTQQRKAIWELGQKGDSRAIQPLVEQMVDSDSQQRSLILAALSEIGTRTLKPMNRALAVSMQDASPDVRKNAIRDLTRVFDAMAQISQILSMAMEDEDQEVQETARYAMSQMNRIRVLPSEGQETRIQYPEDLQNKDGEYNS